MKSLLFGRHTPVVLALCAVGLAALAFGAASLSASPSASPVVQRLHLVERIQHQQFLDLGKHGQSAGDRLVTRSDILDTKGHVIGRADIDCVITGVQRHLGGLCHTVVTLPDGQLVSEFAWGRSGASRYAAIDGGTGKYAGAHGQTIADPSGSDKHEPFVVELMR